LAGRPAGCGVNLADGAECSARRAGLSRNGIEPPPTEPEGWLRGVQDTRVPMWLAIVSYWVIGIPASYVMAFTFDWGPVGLWLGLTVGLGVAAALLSQRFWARSVHIARVGVAS
jgi:hypothetical protein